MQFFIFYHFWVYSGVFGVNQKVQKSHTHTYRMILNLRQLNSTGETLYLGCKFGMAILGKNAADLNIILSHMKYGRKLKIGVVLCAVQFCALYIKRFHHIRKDAKSFFTQILLPAFFVLLAMFSSALLPQEVDQPNLELQPWIYGDGHYVFFSDSASTAQEKDDYVTRQTDQFLIELPHHSTRSVLLYWVERLFHFRGIQ